MDVLFESLVNTEGFKTKSLLFYRSFPFESLVNTEGFKTSCCFVTASFLFESLVNTEGFKTRKSPSSVNPSLRVLLIRKDSKLRFSEMRVRDV